MPTIITDSKHYTDIANAIRLKTGESANFLPAEMAAAIEAISTGASNAVEFTAPFGRVKGDVDGDGQVTVADQLLLQQYFASNSPMLSDEIVGWCSEVHFDGKISSKDFTKIGQHAGKGYNIFCSCVDAGINPEYYNNWFFHKIDSLNGYFYHDIEVKGMTANSSAFLLASSHSKLFEGVECMEGVARIKVKIPPIEPVECVLIWEADGTTWKDANGNKEIISATLPMGRMKGDINGDGVVNGTYEDVQNDNRAVDTGLLWAKFSGFVELDEIQTWCGNVASNVDSTDVTSTDAMVLIQHTQGTRNIFCDNADAGINPDYYNNWNFYKIDSLNGYFYHDIPVEGMTNTSSAFLLVSDYSDCFIGIECMEGIARVKAERLPLADTKCLIVWETDGTIWEDANGGFKTVDVDIPLGRMKGDIDGDGLINSTDYDLLFEHTSESTQITDEVNLWCADIKQDSSIDGLDLTRLDKHIKGTANLLCTSANGGVNPDYYNNWTFHRIDNLNGYFYRDIPIKGMNTNSTAVLLVSDYADCFEGVECLENAARIKASRCPVGNCKGNILWKTFEQSKLTVVASAVL